jgi:hypothetical protein
VITTYAHWLAFSLISAVLAQNTPPQPRVIASSSEWSITAEQYEEIVKTFPAEDRPRFVDSDNRRGLVNELVRIWVLTTEARKNGISVGTDYQSRRDYYQNYAREAGSKISEETVRKYFDDHLDDFTRVALSHILILNGGSPITPYPDLERLPYEEAEKKAKEIKAMLDKGADWDTVSKEYSQEKMFKDKGGTVGYIAKGMVEKSIETAAFALKVGEISDVVGSVFGFHILKITDRKVATFEELREPIRRKLTTDEVNRQLDLKVKEANVAIDETFFVQ